MVTVEEILIRVMYDGNNANSGLNSFKSSLLGIGASLTAIGATMTQKLTRPIIDGFGYAIKSSMDFEQQLDRTGALAGATEQDIKKLKEEAMDLGRKTQYSALKVAQGQTEMIKAGRTLTQTLDEMDDVLNLATAGELSIARASEISANMMNMFSDQGIKAVDVANLMAGAANNSAIDVNEFYNSMSYVGPVASSLKISFQDVSSAIAVLGNNAIKGSKAGTGLRQFLMRLQPQSDSASSAMKALGIITADGSNRFYDATGKLKSLNEILNILRTSTAKLSDKDKQQKLKDMFGLIASPTVLSLLNAESTALDDMTKRINNISASEVASKKLDNLAGSIKILKSSAETLAITFGDLLAPYVRKLADMLTFVTNKFIGLNDGTKKTIMILAGIVAGIGPLVTMAGLISIAIATISAPVLAVVAGISALVTGFGVLATQTNLIKDVFAILQKRFEEFNPKILDIIDSVKIIIPALKAVFDFIYPYILKTFNQVVSFLSGLVTIFQGVFKMLGGLLSGDWSKVWDGIKLIFKGAIDSIIAYFGVVISYWTTIGATILAVVKPSIVSAWNSIVSFFSDVGTAIATTAVNMWNSIVNTFTSFKNTVVGIVTGFVNTIANAFIWLYNHNYYFKALADFIINTFNITKAFITTIWNTIASFLNSVWNGIRNVASSVFNSLWSIASNAFQSMANAISSKASSAMSSASNVMNGIKNVITSLASSAYDWGTNLINMFINGVKSKAGALAGVAKDMASSVASFLGFHSPAKEGAGKDADKWMPNLVNMLTEDLNNGIAKIRSASANLAMTINPEQYLTSTPMPSSGGNNNVSIVMYNSIAKEVDADKVMGKVVNTLKRMGVTPNRN